MPEISRFFGIIITMYHREHGSPHFHAWYSGNEITVDIANRIIQELAQRQQSLMKIKPLE